MARWQEAPFSGLLAEKTKNGVYKAKKLEGTGAKYLRMGDLFANDRILMSIDGLQRMPLTQKELDQHHLQPGDLLFCRTSVAAQGVGKCSIVVSVGEPIVAASNMIRARINREIADPFFYFYYFTSEEGAERIRSRTRGVAVFTVTGTDIAGLDVPVPPKSLQRKVSAVLAAYDELIDNNLRRIEILEEMAQAVYREWFVNFRFPGHDDIARVDSPLGPIPKGWEVRKYGDIAAEIKDGEDPGGVDPDVRYIGLEHIPQQSFTLTSYGSVTDVTSRKWRFRRGDVLFGRLRPYFHKVVEAGFAGICSTDAIVIRADVAYRDLALQIAFSKEFVEHAVSTSGGTDRPRAKWTDLADFDVVVPDIDINLAFTGSVRPMVDLAANLAHQNANLGTTRDLLLPKLVSGEIDVSDLDIDTDWLAV